MRHAQRGHLYFHFSFLHISHSGPPPPLDEAALEKLSSYDFPGNVRELENVIEQMQPPTRNMSPLAEKSQIQQSLVSADTHNSWATAMQQVLQ